MRTHRQLRAGVGAARAVQGTLGPCRRRPRTRMNPLRGRWLQRAGAWAAPARRRHRRAADGAPSLSPQPGGVWTAPIRSWCAAWPSTAAQLRMRTHRQLRAGAGGGASGSGDTGTVPAPHLDWSRAADLGGARIRVHWRSFAVESHFRSTDWFGRCQFRISDLGEAQRLQGRLDSVPQPIYRSAPHTCPRRASLGVASESAWRRSSSASGVNIRESLLPCPP
jgi:hypothetical protein